MQIVARARRVVFRRIDANFDLVGRETCCLFLFRVAQIALVVATSDHAEQRHTAALLVAQQRMHRFSACAAGQIMQGNFDGSFGAVITVHSAVHGGERTIDVARITAYEMRQ